MAERAKIVRHGDHQAVELPESVRFPDDQDEVLVRRDGLRLIMEPLEPRTHPGWSPEFLACLGTLSEDETFERLPQIPVTELKDPFE